MSKLAWYVVIMVAIDMVLYLARFCVKAAKNTKKDDAPSEGIAPRETEANAVSSDATGESAQKNRKDM